MGDAGLGVRRRVLWVFGAAVLMLLLLVGRLVWLQGWRGPALYQRAVDVRTRVVPVQAPRGEILDDRGHVLAMSVGAESVYATPAQIPDKAATAIRLATVLDLNPATIEKRLKQHVMFVWIARRVSNTEAAAVRTLDLPGISLVQESRRIYPAGMLAAQLLGFVGIDNQGLGGGVEVSYNRQLSGTPGELIIETDARNQEIPKATRRYVAPKPGDTLRLTLDSTLQGITQRALDQGVAQAHAQSGLAIMMDPKTGGILALAAWPTYDSNEARNADPSLWTNPVITYAFSPGSVFKPITAAAALQTGVVTPSTPFDDSGVLRVPGATISNFNHRGLGATTFAVGFEKSANTIFGRVGLMLGVQRFYEYLKLFGFMSRTGVDLPGESARPSIITPESRATPLDLAEEAFGQTLAVTPLSMITAISAIANGGELMWPHVGLSLEAPNGQVVQRITPKVVRRVISPETAYQLQGLMARVVTNGSGKNAAVPCYSVAGKTGTTQKYENGRVAQGQYIGSFVGYAPAHGAVVALYVMIDEPQGLYYGGQVAAPVFAQIMRQTLPYLGVQPSCPKGVSPDTAAPPEEMVPMPNLVGMDAGQAERVAAEAGVFLKVSGSGQVLRQVPPAGTQVQKWSTVLAYTTPAEALPEPRVTVPDLQGMTLTAAGQALAHQGLQLQADGAGVVVAQQPPPGTTLSPGDVVRVTMGVRSARAKVPG